MIVGMYRISGSEVLASQLNTLGSHTPIRSATSRWSIFKARAPAPDVIPNGLQQRGNPDHAGSAVRLRQDKRHRVGLAEAVGDGSGGLL
jgi:hypothetical protein